MPHAGVYVLASLISSVSAALILASGPSYTEPRSPQGTENNAKRGQSAYDGCRAGPCQIVYLNSVEDFCLWAPSQPALSATRDPEHTLVAWCMKSAHGTRLIPDGAISGAHLVITSKYVQITGVGSLTNINVPANGVASASWEGDRAHGLVFTTAYGQLEQIHEWTSFVSQERFCFRACRPSAAASTVCPEIHDIFECSEHVPGNYDAGAFEECIGDPIEVPSTLYQGVLAAASHHSPHPPSSCATRRAVANTQVARARRAIAPILVTSPPHWRFRPHSHNTPVTSSVAPTTTDTATTIAFPSSPTSGSAATTFTNSSTLASSNAPAFTPYSYNHTHTYSHRHSHTNWPLHHSFSHPPSSSSTASSPNDPSSTSSASSSPISLTSPYTLTIPFPAYSSSEPSSLGTPTSFVTSTPTSIPIPIPIPTATPASMSSSYGTSSSFPGLPSPSSTPVVATPTSSPTPPSMSPQSSYVLTFTTPSSSSVPTTSPASSSPTVPNSQTQIGSQCPPLLQVAMNTGSVVPLPPLLPLMLTILMIVISSSVGVLVL